MKSTASGLTTTAALTMAAALSLSVYGPHRAYASTASSSIQFESSLAITVLSPTPHTSFSGSKPVEVSAFYQGADNNQIVAIELFVDGSGVYTKRLEAPEARGVISFLIDASQLTSGNHSIVVRAIASDQQVVSAKSSFIFVADKPSNQTEIAQPVTTTNSNSVLPELTYISPSADQSVSGNVKILLKASDSSGRSPYVSLFIDRTFKTLRNYPPYEYEWDTTSYPNGYHTIEAYAYNEDQNVGPAKILRVLVNNPSGRTQIRKDLKDASSTPGLKPVKKLAPASLADSQIKHGQTKANPAIIASHKANTPVNTVNPDLSDPYIPNIPVTSEKSIKVAKLPTTIERTVISPASGLSDPFVKDAAPTSKPETQSNKAIGPARRPTPRMALSTRNGHSAHIRAIMMAKRQELLDQTGGLTLQSELSDPFIPETATLKQVPREAKTPMTGFKPLPKQRASQNPALATVTPGEKPQITQPSIISRDAHTMPVKLPTPSMVQPLMKAVAPMIQAVTTPALPVAKHIAIRTEILPIAKTVAINNNISTEARLATPVISEKEPQIKANYILPVAKTVKINTSHMTAHKVAIHTGGSVNLTHAKGQMKVLFNHTMLRLDRPITEKSGVMFSPLRQIFEFQGGSLTWQPKTGTVHAKSDTKDINLTIGDCDAKINDRLTVLDGAPFLSQGRTMVPLSLLPLALDVDVQYDETSGHLLVVTKH